MFPNSTHDPKQNWLKKKDSRGGFTCTLTLPTITTQLLLSLSW